jgi:hypothetical protein
MIATRNAMPNPSGRVTMSARTYRGGARTVTVSAAARRNHALRGEVATHMKTVFIIIGVVVIFGILFSSGGLAGGLCVQGVGCVRSDGGGGVKLDKTETVTISTGRP